MTVGRRTRKQLVGRTEAADRLACDKQLRRLRREIKAARRAYAQIDSELIDETEPNLSEDIET